MLKPNKCSKYPYQSSKTPCVSKRRSNILWANAVYSLFVGRIDINKPDMKARTFKTVTILKPFLKSCFTWDSEHNASWSTWRPQSIWSSCPPQCSQWSLCFSKVSSIQPAWSQVKHSSTCLNEFKVPMRMVSDSAGGAFLHLHTGRLKNIPIEGTCHTQKNSQTQMDTHQNLEELACFIQCESQISRGRR